MKRKHRCWLCDTDNLKAMMLCDLLLIVIALLAYAPQPQ